MSIFEDQSLWYQLIWLFMYQFEIRMLERYDSLVFGLFLLSMVTLIKFHDLIEIKAVEVLTICCIYIIPFFYCFTLYPTHSSGNLM